MSVPDWLMQVLAIVSSVACSAAASYAAIRADLAALHVKADLALDLAREALKARA